jgi:uncharacterized protein YbcI
MPDRLLVPQQLISNEIAHLYKLRIGRGPTRVATTIAGDLVTCVLECTRTPQETTMFEAGARDLLHDVRKHFQLHVAPTMIGIVERATGRTVSGHIPGYNQDIDVAIETFMLEDGYDDPTVRSDASASDGPGVPPAVDGGDHPRPWEHRRLPAAPSRADAGPPAGSAAPDAQGPPGTAVGALRRQGRVERGRHRPLGSSHGPVSSRATFDRPPGGRATAGR